MTKVEAFNLITQAAVQFRGTLADHQNIQEALRELKDLLDSLENKNQESADNSLSKSQ